LRYPPTTPFEVIVVDNASVDGSAEWVREYFPSIRLLTPGINTGYARGNNLAFAEAQGEYLLTLNPDTEVEADTLQTAMDVLDSQPAYGALGIRLIGPDGQGQSSVRGFPSVMGIVGDLTGLGRRHPGSKWDSYRMTGFDYEVEQPAPQPMGTFLLFRRSALAQVGDVRTPFDERFPIFFNEVDLLYRMAAAGLPCLYTPKTRLLHHHGQGTRQVRRSMIWESHKSLVRFLRKHGSGGWNRLGLPLVAAIIYAAAFVRARGYSAGFRA
jgi:hypothetical protein